MGIKGAIIRMHTTCLDFRWLFGVPVGVILGVSVCCCLDDGRLLLGVFWALDMMGVELGVDCRDGGFGGLLLALVGLRDCELLLLRADIVSGLVPRLLRRVLL
jgi:hypothetical protein